MIAPPDRQDDIESHDMDQRQKLTALVICYNRRDLIGTCLNALAFADEILVIDKSSSDGTAEIAAGLADRLITVPWSPVVEETRAFAIAQCKHDWILCLDDDQCLSSGGIEFLHQELLSPRAEVYMIPQRNYILGRHDEDAYYWPEYQPLFFHKNAIEMQPVVHGGMVIKSDRIYNIPLESGVCIHHLSHKDVAQWIEKANRYTSMPNRMGEDDGSRDLVAFSHSRIDGWLGQSTIQDNGSYLAAVAILRAVYDIIDRIKLWENEEDLDGDRNFQKICRTLDADYGRIYSNGLLRRPHAGGTIAVESSIGLPDPGQAERAHSERIRGLQGRVRRLRCLYEAARKYAADECRAAIAQARQERDAAIAQARQERDAAIAQAHQERDAAVAQAQKERETAVAQATATTASTVRHILEYRSRIEKNLHDQLNAARLRIAEVEAKHLQTETTLNSVLSSESWRLTAPVRSAIQITRRLTARNLKRVQLLRHAADPRNKEHRLVLAQAVRRRFVAVSRPVSDSLPAVIRAPHVWSDHAASEIPAKNLAELSPHQAAVASYPIWSLRFDTPSTIALKHWQDTAACVPEVLVIVRFSSSTHHLIGRTAHALKALVGVRWKAAIISSAQQDADFAATCAESFGGDGRFDNRPDHQGKVLVFLEGGAIPRRHGIRVLVEKLMQNHDVAMVYADEDCLLEQELPQSPWFKPEYSPLLAAQGLLFGRMFAVRSDSTRHLLPAETIFDPARSVPQVAIGITSRLAGKEIGHAAHVAFHNVLPPRPAIGMPLPTLESEPFVSILIPTRDRWDLLGACLKSLGSTQWPRDRLEIIVIDNGSVETECLEGLVLAVDRSEISVIRDNRKFNYASLNNAAARAARGDVLVLLNNDTEVIDPAWLRKLVSYAVQPGVGAVGAKLLYEDRTVQHGGLILGIQGGAAHAHVFTDQADGGYQNLANTTHEVAAVTGACLAVSREAFEEVNGLREEFAVAFNDLAFCLDLYERGRRNIYVADCVMIHHESKTRGFDVTPDQIATARKESLLCWQEHAKLLRSDPFYSPNLSLETPFKLSFAPRRRALWRAPSGKQLTVLVLSSTFSRGHGVAVVIDLQVRALLDRGHKVILAGTKNDRDLPFGGIEVMELSDPRSAATMAAELEADVIVAHTPPFYSVARWTGTFPPVLAYDYGEPPPGFFPDAAARRDVIVEKTACLRMCTRVLAISRAVADESLVPPDGVIPLGNSHLGMWSPALVERRAAARKARGWDACHVILNVSRFHAGERHYKGIESYADMLAVFQATDPDFAARCVFVLCGKGDEQDIADVRASGITVIANVSDEEMIDLYAAADMYANFSQWEGYNLGIGQALAMGLPVVASDIPAHRAFGVPLADNAVSAAFLLRERMREGGERRPRIWGWDEPLGDFVREIERLARPAPVEVEPAGVV